MKAPESLLLRSALSEARTVSDVAGNRKLAERSGGGRRALARDDAAAAVILAVAEADRRGAKGASSLPPGKAPAGGGFADRGESFTGPSATCSAVPPHARERQPVRSPGGCSRSPARLPRAVHRSLTSLLVYPEVVEDEAVCQGGSPLRFFRLQVRSSQYTCPHFGDVELARQRVPDFFAERRPCGPVIDVQYQGISLTIVIFAATPAH